MNGKRTKYSQQIQDAAYWLYVRDHLGIAEIHRRLGIPERTLGNWRKNRDWDADRERYGKSTVALINALENTAAELTINLESADIERRIETISLLDKITAIKARLDNRVDRLPVVLELVEDLCSFARREIDPAAKPALEKLLRRWAESVRDKYREAA